MVMETLLINYPLKQGLKLDVKGIKYAAATTSN